MQFLYLFIILFFSIQVQATCVKEYYNLTNKAELAICDEKLDDANLFYQQAFALDCSMAHKVDLYNAMIVCGKLQKWSLAKRYLILLREKGLSYDFLEKKVKAYFPSKTGILKRLKKIDLSPELKQLDNELATLLYFDQMVRRDCPGYPSHCRERVKYVDSLVFIRFKGLIADNGGWVDGLSSHDSPIGTPYYWSFILHNSAWQRYWVHDEMKKALEEGKIHPSVFADLVDRFHHNNTKGEFPKYASKPWYELNSEHYLMVVKEEDRAEINKNRAAIFLGSIDEQKKKVLFKMKHKEYLFFCAEKLKAELPVARVKKILEEGTMERVLN